MQRTRDLAPELWAHGWRRARGTAPRHRGQKQTEEPWGLGRASGLVAGERRLAAALVLFVGAARYGDGADHVAALDDRQRAAPGHDAAVARHDEALEPGLRRYAAQLIRGLLEAGRGIRLVRGHIHRDRPRAVHAAQRDRATALV